MDWLKPPKSKPAGVKITIKPLSKAELDKVRGSAAMRETKMPKMKGVRK